MHRGSVDIDTFFAVVANKAPTFGDVIRNLFPCGEINARFAGQAMYDFTGQQTRDKFIFIIRNH